MRDIRPHAALAREQARLARVRVGPRVSVRYRRVIGIPFSLSERP